MSQKHWQRRLATSLLPSTLLAVTASAQTTGNGNRLEEIVVTATRLERTLGNVPAAVSVVTEDDIQVGRQQLALDEAMGRVPGLFMQNRYNFAQDLRLSIRGFGARAQFGIRGIKLLVDGIPETLPDGQGSVDSIDLGATSQIEVIRGPSSTLYGNASGGVISIVSEGGGEEPFAEVRLMGGAYDFQKLQLKTGGQTDRVNYLVSLSDLEFDGYREQSRFESRQLSGRFDIDLGKDRKLLTVVNFTDQPVSEDPGGLTLAALETAPRSAAPNNVLFNAGEALEQTRVGFVYSMPLGENQTLTARNYYAWRDFDSMLPSGPGGVVEFDRRFIGGGLTYTYEGVWLDRPNRVVVGFDFDDQDDDRQRFNNLQGVRGDLTFAQNERVKSRGVFIQNELSVTRDLQLTLGLRFDQVDFDVTDHFLGDGDDSGTLEFEDTSPMAGIVYKLGPRTSLYATYSSAFETPTTTELNRPDLLGGFNPNLVPQVARNLEVGARGALGSKSHYEVALFTIDVEDELIGFEVPNNPGRSYYENVGESKRDGIELSFVTNITDNLQTTVSYAYSDFKFTEYLDFSGNRIPGTVQNLLFAELAYRSPKGWFAIGDVTYVDEQFGDNANTVLVPDYTLANLRFGYSVDLGNLELQPFVGVNNLFDETYVSNVRINAAFNRYFEPGPGRNGYAGVTLNWKF